MIHELKKLLGNVDVTLSTVEDATRIVIKWNDGSGYQWQDTIRGQLDMEAIAYNARACFNGMSERKVYPAKEAVK